MNGLGAFDDQTLPLSVTAMPDRKFAFIRTLLYFDQNLTQSFPSQLPTKRITRASI